MAGCPEKKKLNITCGFLYPLQRFSETFLIPRRIQQNIIINVHRSPRKVPAGLARFNTNFLNKKISKRLQIPNIMKIYLVGAELFHANKPDRWTDKPIDMTKLIVAFRKSANVPKNDN